MGLVVRGPCVEWGLETATEVLTQTERLQSEGRFDDLGTPVEFGEAGPTPCAASCTG